MGQRSFAEEVTAAQQVERKNGPFLQILPEQMMVATVATVAGKCLWEMELLEAEVRH